MQASVPERTDEAGFSLFESMVALAIFALVALSSLQLVTQNADAVSRLEVRANAGFVAQNVLVETRFEKVLNTSETTGKAQMGGFSFEWVRVVTDMNDAHLKRVLVKVRKQDDPQVISQLEGMWHD